MNKPIARFVFRGCDENDGLILGSAFKGHDFFKPNEVYQIERQLLDENCLVIRPIGESSVNKGSCNDKFGEFGWYHDINWILSCSEKAFIKTREEVKRMNDEKSK